MYLHFKSDCLPTNEVFTIGLTKGAVDLHVAIVLMEDASPVICHWAWHNLFEKKALVDDLYLCFRPILGPSTLRTLRETCLWLCSRNVGSSAPYGFTLGKPAFHADSGICILTDGEGLTCATFICSLCDYVGISVLDVSTWEVEPSNSEFAAQIANLMERTKERFAISQEHIDATRAATGILRIRPEDIVAAFASPKLSFTSAQRERPEVRAIIQCALWEDRQ